MVHRFDDHIRFCHSTGRWHVWDGTRWSVDESGEIMRLASRTARGIYREAADNSDKDTVKGIADWAKQSESRFRLDALVALARSQEGVAVTAGQLDANAWLLNCRNGTIDLKTGTLKPHDRADLITKIAPVEYIPDVEVPRWQGFLQRIFGGDLDLIAYVQRYWACA